ncbi:MAG: hypothetical protein ACTSYD_04535 [Candidatus Heimdallarchaeaceae archaeon]
MYSENLTTIAELGPNTRELNFKAKVIELGEIKAITKRDTGEEHQVQEILLGDETGTVLLSAWNENVNAFEVGKTYLFRNAKTILFQRHIRVSLGRLGTVEEIDSTIEEINEDNNVSEAEHEMERRYSSYSNRDSYYSHRRY